MEKIKFKTEKTWVVGNQEWSDMITKDDGSIYWTFDEAIALNATLSDG